MTPPLSIPEKLEALREVYDKQTEATAELYRLREEIQAKIDDVSEPFADQARILEEEIRADVLAAGKSCKTEIATVTYRKGYTRTTWDGKGLAGFAVAHPEVNAFRNETEVQPSVSWRWNNL